MSEAAIRFENVGKMYKVFGSRRDSLLDAVGIRRLLRQDGGHQHEFWALRGIDFELPQGGRLGIIGRNGAGKSTLLKLVTQNFPSTEGRVEVYGAVQALLEVGSGLHPEFTGRENIDASLGLLGLSKEEIDAATDDIAEFTELGRFLDQPFKTYSLGMQARLGIGIATTVKPQILIIDEVLGAGDAYFFAKSTARMQQLLSDGTSVLLVSHALDQVARFCEETIWLDRGRIVMRGQTTEVVKAYEKFTRDLDDRRLRAKNRKVKGFDAFERDTYTATLEVRIATPAGTGAEIDSIELLRDGTVEDSIDIGNAQDADPSQQAHLLLGDGDWSEIATDAEGASFRRIAESGLASALFNVWFLYPDSDYSVRVRYRNAGAPASVSVLRGETTVGHGSLPPKARWEDVEVALNAGADAGAAQGGGGATASRWSGSASFTIDSVRLLDAEGAERAIFAVGEPLIVEVGVGTHESGRFPFIPAALTFSHHGVVATRHVGQPVELDVQPGETVSARLELGPLLLGNGTYLLSVGLYSTLDIEEIEPSEYYDYFDRSFEFKVVGNPRLHNELVRHPGTWTVTSASFGDRPSKKALSS